MEITADHITAIASVIGVIFVVIRLTHDSKWKKTETAKSLNNQMIDNFRAKNARLMIDWTHGRFFEINLDGAENLNSLEKIPVTRQEIYDALDLHGVESLDPLEAKEIFIRDCFDKFFYFMGVFEHYIFRGLVDFEDVRYPMEYYIKYLMSTDPEKNICEEEHFKHFRSYLTRYGFKRSLDFINRFT